MISPLNKSQMNLGKSQYYGCDGTGRDTYIYNINGGFCPEKQAVKVEELGKYIFVYFDILILGSFMI